MADFAVIGLGAWGGALARHLSQKGLQVMGWARNTDLVERLNTKHTHPSFEDSITFPKNFVATSDIKRCWEAQTIVIAVPSKGLAEISVTCPTGFNGHIISAIKGLESSTSATPLNYLSGLPAFAGSTLSVLSGPSFASDVAHGRPVSIVAASKRTEDALKVAEIFTNGNLRVYGSADPLGVELGGITKNVIAIAAGISDALGCGPSARAGLITRGLAEMTRFAKGLGADAQTLAGLSGLGDLIMTATDDQSRNRRVGIAIGQGLPIPEAITRAGGEAEGVRTAPLILKRSKELGIEMPITGSVVEVLEGRLAPKDTLQLLLTRPIKEEGK